MKTKFLLIILLVLCIISGCTAVRRSLHVSEPQFYSTPCLSHDSCQVYNFEFHLRY